MIPRLKKPLIGGHLRLGDGLRNVPMEARALGYSAVQVMVGASQGWLPYDISDETAAEFRKNMYGVETYVHMPFMINPCESDKRTRNFAKVTFRRFEKVARNLGARALVIHAGFKKEQTEEQAYKNYLEFFEYLTKEKEEKGDPKILMETDAGSKNGSAIGSVDWIANALKDLGDPRLGMCLDTAHLYARGVDMWDEATRDGVIAQCGEKVRLVHLNVPDPNVEFGGHLDRHNSTFEGFTRDSVPLIETLIPYFPLILERSSLSVQEQDAKYIRKILAIKPVV